MACDSSVADAASLAQVADGHDEDFIARRSDGADDNACNGFAPVKSFDNAGKAR